MQLETSFYSLKRTKSNHNLTLIFWLSNFPTVTLISSTSFKSHGRIKDLICAISLTLSGGRYGPGVLYHAQSQRTCVQWAIQWHTQHSRVRSHANLFDERDSDKRASQQCMLILFNMSVPYGNCTVGYFSVAFFWPKMLGRMVWFGVDRWKRNGLEEEGLLSLKYY